MQEDDDGFIVYESRAIARYLVLKYAPNSGLIPKRVKESALFEQAVSIEISNFTPYVQGIAAEKFFKPWALLIHIRWARPSFQV